MNRKSKYKSLLLREFYFSGQCSCAYLSEVIDRSLPMTMQLINELIAEGSVIECGFAPSSGGRRPAMYSLRAESLFILAVSMDQLVTRISLMDIFNRQVSSVKSFDIRLQNNPLALKELNAAMEEAITASGVDREKVIGAGIGMPGFIDVESGGNYSFFREHEQDSIAAILTAGLKIPVYIDNDSSLIALAEHKFGVAKEAHNTMVINAGWGVGLGIIMNGELFRGNEGFAGEFSHLPLFDNNKLCSCGKSGCLETETSLLVTIEKAKQALVTGKRISMLSGIFPSGNAEKDSDAILDSAIKGDRLCVELLSQSAYNIGRGIAILIHLLNPEMIVISGRASRAGKIWEASIQQALNEHCIPRLWAKTKIEISNMGYRAELIGAAALVMENRVRENTRFMKAKNKLFSSYK